MHKANVYKMPHAWNVFQANMKKKKPTLTKNCKGLFLVKFKFTYEIILQYVYPLFKVVQGNTITKVNILASSRQIGIRYRQ